MSTKTSFKRIALVAVAALGFGMLSVAPSNAETTADTMAASATASSTTVGTAASIYVTQTFIGGANTDYLKATAYVTSAPAYSVALPTWTALTSDSATALGYTQVSATMDATVAGTIKVTNSTSGAAYVQATNKLSFTPAVPGTYVIKLYQTNATSASAPGSPAAAQAAPITWTVTAGATNAANATYSKVWMQIGSTQKNDCSGGGSTPCWYASAWNSYPYPRTTAAQFTIGDTNAAANKVVNASDATLAGTVDAGAANVLVGSVANSAAKAGTVVAGIAVHLRNNTPALDNAGATPITATISGPGYVSVNGSQIYGKTVTESIAYTGSDGYGSKEKSVFVYSDGTNGTATITISAGGVTIATRTVIFYGTVAKAVADNESSVVDLVGGEYVYGGASVYLTDSNGNPVLGAAASIKATSSDLTVLQSRAAGSSNGCYDYSNTAAGEYGPGYYICTVLGVPGVVSGKTATMTYSVYSGVTLLAASNAVTFTTGEGKISSLALTLDKTDYLPGELAKLTITATDASGNPVADGKYFVFNSSAAATTAFAGLSTSAPVTKALFSTTAAVASPATDASGIYFSKGIAYTTFYMPYASGTFTISGTTSGSSASLSTGLKNFGYGTAVKVTANVTADTVSQAAADAAAEATDAANAATDAANAAAEAADAATAAAQDAADAVAALSTSVTAMVDALKKQITALTNLVIKIQKKVKA
jgi:hypothetical protein